MRMQYAKWIIAVIKNPKVAMSKNKCGVVLWNLLCQITKWGQFKDLKWSLAQNLDFSRGPRLFWPLKWHERYLPWKSWRDSMSVLFLVLPESSNLEHTPSYPYKDDIISMRRGKVVQTNVCFLWRPLVLVWIAPPPPSWPEGECGHIGEISPTQNPHFRPLLKGQ